MSRPAFRCLSRPYARPVIQRRAQVRSVGTSPPHLRPRSFRSSVVRWGIAVFGIYYYNTSPLFAQEPTANDLPAQNPDDAPLPTLASLSPSSRLKPPSEAELPSIPPTPTPSSPPSIDPKAPPPPADSADATSPQGLEDEASSQGAFNEETGEINWDCPCLGGMAHGLCGEEFRAAFSCFVFSKEEPKGMDCIDRFKGMQDCFRRHPDVYGDELADEEEAERAAAAEAAAGEGAPAEGAGQPLGEGAEAAPAPASSAPTPAVSKEGKDPSRSAT